MHSLLHSVSIHYNSEKREEPELKKINLLASDLTRSIEPKVIPQFPSLKGMYATHHFYSLMGDYIVYHRA
jgi:hypothetical protein